MAYVEIIEGFNKGKSVALDGETMVGRSPANKLCLPDGRASRQHALIQPDGEGFTITDLGSANGTFLNDTQLQNGAPTGLREGDQIQVCSTRLIYHGADAPSAAPVAAAAPGLAMVMKDDGGIDELPAVNATLDASMNILELREEEKQSEKGLLDAIKRLQAMVKVAGDLGSVTERDALVERIMDSIFDIFPSADRALIMTRDAKTKELTFAGGRDRNALPGQQPDFVMSSTITKSVIEKKQSVLSSDAQQDFGAQQSIVDLSIRSMMCAPMVWQDDILGIINVDTMSTSQTFSPDDLAMLTGIAAQAGSALKNVSLIKEIASESQKTSELSRYMSPDLAKGIVEGTVSAELGGKRVVGTVFFCDIVGFTAMSEKMAPVQVVDKLNDYFSITTDIVAKNKGTIDKFGGDLIMAHWNAMFPHETPELSAIITSLQMQSAVWVFDLDLRAEGQSEIVLGIGVNTGEFAAGNIGGERIEYTVIGDNVNLGARIESLANRWQVFASGSTYEPISKSAIAVKMKPIMVKGKTQPILIYSVRGVLLSGGEMLLCLPVHLQNADGQESEGLLTGLLWDDEDMRLELSTEANLPDTDRLSLTLDMPEHHQTFKLSGVVRDENRDTHHGRVSYSKITLVDLAMNEDTRNFLQPGSLVETEKEWDEMTR